MVIYNLRSPKEAYIHIHGEMYGSSLSAENTLMASSAIRSGYNHRRFTRDGAGGMLSKIRGGRDFSTISAYSCSKIRVINGYYKV